MLAALYIFENSIIDEGNLLHISTANPDYGVFEILMNKIIYNELLQYYLMMKNASNRTVYQELIHNNVWTKDKFIEILSKRFDKNTIEKIISG